MWSSPFPGRRERESEWNKKTKKNKPYFYIIEVYLIQDMHENKTNERI